MTKAEPEDGAEQQEAAISERARICQIEREEQEQEDDIISTRFQQSHDWFLRKIVFLDKSLDIIFIKETKNKMHLMNFI
jgi:hypothetical protein